MRTKEELEKQLEHFKDQLLYCDTKYYERWYTGYISGLRFALGEIDKEYNITVKKK